MPNWKSPDTLPNWKSPGVKAIATQCRCQIRCLLATSQIRSLLAFAVLRPTSNIAFCVVNMMSPPVAKGHTPAWGIAPLIHIPLMWPPIDWASLLVAPLVLPTLHLFGASDVAPLSWCFQRRTSLVLFLQSWMDWSGSDKPNECCHNQPVFATASIKSDLVVGNNPQPDLLRSVQLSLAINIHA